MADLIKLVTWNEQNVAPVDDAVLYETAIPDSGMIYGGVITEKSESVLHISAGHGIVCGRKFTIFEGDIPVTLSPSGTLRGRVYLHLDLSNASEPVNILVETAQSLTPPIQDEDVNITDGVYEFNMALFSLNMITISNIENVSPRASTGGSVIEKLEKSHTQFLHTFDAATFSLVSSGDWSGYYKSSKGVEIFNPSGSVRASGTTLSSPPSDAVKSAVSTMYFEIDDTANTLTAYAKTAPTTAIYVAVEGVQ